MIRLSVKSDYNDLIVLWKEAFGDEEEAIKMFLDSRYIPDNTVVAEENGKIISMLFLLEGNLKISNKLYPSYYLYAAATAKSERGRGIMAKMLEFAESTALSRNIEFICLKPAEDSLYGYYERFGYKTVFATKTVRITDFNRYVSDEALLSDSKIDLSDVRYRAFSETDGFIWDNNAVEYAVKQHNYYGGNIFETRNGFCIYTTDDEKCDIKEFCFTPDNFDNVISVLNTNLHFNEITVDLPVSYCCSADEEIIKNNGMALAVTDNAKSVINNISNAYLNLTLD